MSSWFDDEIPPGQRFAHPSLAAANTTPGPPIQTGLFAQLDSRRRGLIPEGVPTANEEALQTPRVDPVQTLAGGFGAENFATDAIKDIVFQGALGALPESREPIDASRTEAIPGWFKPPEQLKYKVAETDRLRSNAEGSRYPSSTDQLNRWEKPYVYDSYPEYHSKLPPLEPVGDNPPNPGDLLYHGLSTDQQWQPKLATETALKRVEQIQQQGLKNGWFAEAPHKPFGPLFVGTKPPADWGVSARRRRQPIDPLTEIQPTSYDYEPIPPHELFLVDHHGNLLGRMGKQGQGLAHPSLQQAPPSEEAESVLGPESSVVKAFQSGAKEAGLSLEKYMDNNYPHVKNFILKALKGVEGAE